MDLDKYTEDQKTLIFSETLKIRSANNAMALTLITSIKELLTYGNTNRIKLPYREQLEEILDKVTVKESACTQSMNNLIKLLDNFDEIKQDDIPKEFQWWN